MEGRVLLNREEITEVCKRLGKEISDKYRNDEKIPVLVGVLKGSLNFMMELMNYVNIPVYTDYIQVKSYSGTTSTGKVQLLKDVSFDCTNRSVVIVEDIIDTGFTLAYLVKHFKNHNPKNVDLCCMFNKKATRKVDIDVEFVGVELEGSDFLLGFGLDYEDLYRNLPYVMCCTKNDVEEMNKILEKDRK